MKKKGIIFLLFIVVALSLCFTVCAKSKDNALTEVCEVKLDLKPNGHYFVDFELGDQFSKYEFSEPNERFTVFHSSSGWLLVGDNDDIYHSYYAKVYIGDSQFLALSNQYVLVLTKNGKFVISLTDEKVINENDVLMGCPFDDLSDEKKETFIYPTKYIKVSQELRP